MVCHKNKIIFIHIPKTGGSSINKFYFSTKSINWELPNYECLYGWCPKRKIHLQHATPLQLLETNLLTEEQWNTYFKFSFVRNPWDRAYSDYLWIMNRTKIKGTFTEFILRSGPFYKVLSDDSKMSFRGDHLEAQVEFLNSEGLKEFDFIGRFENFLSDIKKINGILNISSPFNLHEKKNSSRKDHYSYFYNNRRKKLISEKYQRDIVELNYMYVEKKKGFTRLLNWL